MEIEEKIQQAASILKRSSYATALTGAGHSTPSGIPDFRSPDSGVWRSVDPFQVASIFAFRQQPQTFYDWVRPMLHIMLNAEPNPAHIALAQLEEMGILKAVITQNIDGLHQRANSKVVYEVHGHLRQATCIRCYAKWPGELLIRDFMESGDIPRCEKCNGVIKPDVILFGEQLPVQTLIASQQAASKSDVMIVAGSSLQVAPAGDIPLLTKERGGKLIFVNFGPTHLDQVADIVIRADVAEVLPRLVRAVTESQDLNNDIRG
jgi:NAD-dependent deacetylase